MKFDVRIEKVTDPDFPTGYYYAQVPTLGLTTHGSGIEGARDAMRDLLELWVAEKTAVGESIDGPGAPLVASARSPAKPYTAADVLARLQRAGFHIRQQSGLHTILRHPDGRCVSIHTREVLPGAFRSILRQARLTEDEFNTL